jgi:hypothetical protein
MMKVQHLNIKAVPAKTVMDLTEMMWNMKHEMEPARASNERRDYALYVLSKIEMSMVLYISKTGFCIVDMVTDSLLEQEHSRFSMMQQIYVVPEKRKSPAYAKLLYEALNRNPGQMIGITYEGGAHDAVLDKRFKKLGTLYGRYGWE